MKHDEVAGPRAALAQAIERRDAVARRIEGLRVTIERLRDERVDAEKRLDAARAAAAGDVDEREQVVDRLIAGGAVTALERPSRATVDEAQTALEAHRRAIGLCEAELKEASADLELKEMSVASAAGDVLAPAFAERLGWAEGKHAELAREVAVLAFLQHALPAGAPEIKRFNLLMHTPADTRHPATEIWRAARAALMRDAATPLP